MVSGLPSACETFNEYSLTVEGEAFQLQVTNLRPDMDCPATYETVTTTIWLDEYSIEPCQTYTVVANGDPLSVQASCPAIETSITMKQPTAGGLCVPAGPLGASVGDIWTMAGTVVTTGSVPGEIPQGAAAQSAGFTVTAIEDSTLGIGDRSTEPVAYQRVQGRSTHTWNDADGNVLQTTDDTTSTRATSTRGRARVGHARVYPGARIQAAQWACCTS